MFKKNFAIIIAILFTEYCVTTQPFLAWKLLRSTKIDLSFRHLKAEDFFLKLQNQIKIGEVTDLKLQGNEFESFLDCSTNISSMRSLDLSQNKLQQFFILCNNEYDLLTLNLSHNYLEWIDDRALNPRIINLKVLDLSYNQITHLNSSMFRHLKNLVTVSLAYNPLKQISENVFTNMSRLRVLSFKGTGIGYFPVKMFANLTNLSSLDLSNNPIEIIPELPNSLVDLDLSSTNLKDIGILQLPLLRKLILDQLPVISHVSLNVFEELEELEVLSMKNLTLLRQIDVYEEDEEYFDFVLLPMLGSMTIQSKKLTSLNESIWPLLERVPRVDFEGNPWKCDCNLIWLREKNLTADLERNFRCSKPSKFLGRLLHSISLDELALICDVQTDDSDHPTDWIIILWILTSLLSLGAVVIIIFFGFRDSEIMKQLRNYRISGNPRYQNVAETPRDHYQGLERMTVGANQNHQHLENNNSYTIQRLVQASVL